MFSSQILRVYLAGTGVLGGYSLGRRIYNNPRWGRLQQEEGLHGEVLVARTVTTVLGAAFGAVVGPVMVPLQVLQGLTEGLRDWVEDG